MTNADKEFQKLIKGMKKFPQNVQKNIMNGATRSATVDIQKQAQANVPYKTGNLKNAIVTRKGRSKDKSKVKYFVGILYGKKSKYDGFYGTFIEYGTKHIQGVHFMQRAIESRYKNSIEIARKYLAKRIPKEALKIKDGR